MSSSKNNNRRTSRRPNRSQRRFGSTSPNSLYAISFPRENKVIMKYLDLQSFTGTVSIANDRVYNLNSIFDPYLTGTGHQPQGYDQWANFYARYRVDACKAIVKYSCDTSSFGTNITILGNNSSSAIIDPSVGAESPLAFTKVYAKGGPATIISHRYNLADLNGVTRSVYETDDRYQSQFGASPTEVLCLHVLTTDLNLESKAMAYTIELVYEVTLFDPIQLTLS